MVSTVKNSVILLHIKGATSERGGVLQGENLRDQEGRVLSSYLKNEAPLSARSFSLKVRAKVY